MLARRLSLRLCVFLGTLTFALGGAQQAFAAKPPSSSKLQARERQAKTACLSGDYVKGVSILAEMFVETNNPVHLFNQGRCYEQNVRYVEAAERFREYLRKDQDIPAAVRANVEKHIADCNAAIAQTQPRPPTESQAAPAAPTAAPEKPTAPESAPIASRDDAPQAPPARQSPSTLEYPWQHTAKWVATGAAVALLGFGAYEHWRYYSKNRDYNGDPKCYDQGQCKDLADAADKAQTLTIIGYGAAGVATGLAIWFWLTDTPRESPAQTAAVSFTCTPTLTGAACGGRF